MAVGTPTGASPHGHARGHPPGASTGGIHRGHPPCRLARPTTEVGVPQSIIDGAAYRSANWILVGKTQGRGKLDCRHEFARPVKDIYLKPLRPEWKTVLNQ